MFVLSKYKPNTLKTKEMIEIYDFFKNKEPLFTS